MTFYEMKEAAEVLLAAAEGKIIQRRRIGYPKWETINTPAWNFGNTAYRIKPEPREYWINVHPTNLLQVYTTKRGAGNCLSPGGKTIHVREVENEL